MGLAIPEFFGLSLGHVHVHGLLWVTPDVLLQGD